MFGLYASNGQDWCADAKTHDLGCTSFLASVIYDEAKNLKRPLLKAPAMRS
jgi:hypothetical protein